ncbi:MAG: hypothetical protein KF753_01255 [Caldilineaceae bacterium]|nr:hypothetical protein [Caldilineaceae bacterium]
MNLWHPIGILISGLIIYWSIEDDRLLRTDPDEYLRRMVRGDGNYCITVQSYLGRFARTHALELAQIEDADRRQAEYIRRVLAMPDRARMLAMARWEVRFRGLAFAVIGLVLLFDWAAGI